MVLMVTWPSGVMTTRAVAGGLAGGIGAGDRLENGGALAGGGDEGEAGGLVAQPALREAEMEADRDEHEGGGEKPGRLDDGAHGARRLPGGDGGMAGGGGGVAGRGEGRGARRCPPVAQIVQKSSKSDMLLCMRRPP
jgi:hypothetical protein